MCVCERERERLGCFLGEWDGGGGGVTVCVTVAFFVGWWGLTGLHFMGDCVCDWAAFAFFFGGVGGDCVCVTGLHCVCVCVCDCCILCV